MKLPITYITVGLIGMSLHHFQFNFFAPEQVGELFGVFAFWGLVMLVVELVIQRKTVK